MPRIEVKKNSSAFQFFSGLRSCWAPGFGRAGVNRGAGCRGNIVEDLPAPSTGESQTSSRGRPGMQKPPSSVFPDATL